MSFNEDKCPRCLKKCSPLSNVVSENKASFICVGSNLPEIRQIKQDRFTVCWKNGKFDERSHWDKRDILDTVSVMTQALSIDENIRVNLGEITEDEMQNKTFV